MCKCPPGANVDLVPGRACLVCCMMPRANTQNWHSAATGLACARQWAAPKRTFGVNHPSLAGRYH
eukprot:1497970-Lingulodinium_polyedra.AAC.1